MPDLSLVILYVDSPTASAVFYADLLGQPATEVSHSFAMFRLSSGAGIGLWSRHTVEPAAAAAGGGGELAFIAADVDTLHADWAERGLVIVQPPTEMDFRPQLHAFGPGRTPATCVQAEALAH